MNKNLDNKKEQIQTENKHKGLKYKVDKNGIVYIVKSFYEDVFNNK